MMTDLRRQAWWVVAAALAPVSAAVFAATTSWSAGHPPVTKTAPAVPDTTAADAANADLQRILDDETAQVAALQTQVAALQKQAAALGRGGSAKTAAAPKTAAARKTAAAPKAGATTRQTQGTRASSSGSGTTRRSGSSARSTPRAPAKAPAVHGVTGGS